MISVDDAITLIVGNRPKAGTEQIELANARGRWLANNVVSKLTLPPDNVSAMDGYAVRLEDVGSPGAELRVIGEAPAGTPFDGTIGAGEAVRIFTGSVIPNEADTVIIQENVARDGDRITVRSPMAEARNIRRKGMEVTEGDVVLTAGDQIGPGHLAVAASANHSDLPVRRKLKVAFIANGDELRPPGSRIEHGQIVSSNTLALSALVQSWGMEAVDLGIATDTPEAIAAKVEEASDADIIVPIGGASVGEHDHMRPTFEAAGLDMLFSKVAVKPGKPTWFGRMRHQFVLGLPGNPASAYVCAHLFLKPLLGLVDSLPVMQARLSGDIPANGDREQLLRAVASTSPELVYSVAPVSNQDSSLKTPFVTANALIRRQPYAAALPDGSIVDIVPLSS